MEFMTSLPIEIIVEKTKGVWESVRYGYVTIGGNVVLKTLGVNKFFYKPTISIKKMVLFQTSDDEDMEAEAGAIIGVTNLLIKKNLKNGTFAFEEKDAIVESMGCFFVDGHKVDAQVVPGFFDVKLYEHDGSRCSKDIAEGIYDQI